MPSNRHGAIGQCLASVRLTRGRHAAYALSVTSGLSDPDRAWRWSINWARAAAYCSVGAVAAAAAATTAVSLLSLCSTLGDLVFRIKPQRCIVVVVVVVIMSVSERRSRTSVFRSE